MATVRIDQRAYEVKFLRTGMLSPAEQDVLARAAQAKGAPLTQNEITKIVAEITEARKTDKMVAALDATVPVREEVPARKRKERFI
jgi:hypothetical protein